MTDVTMGEIADQVKQAGTWTYVGPDGTVWQLQYLGEVQL